MTDLQRNTNIAVNESHCVNYLTVESLDETYSVTYTHTFNRFIISYYISLIFYM